MYPSREKTKVTETQIIYRTAGIWICMVSHQLNDDCDCIIPRSICAAKIFCRPFIFYCRFLLPLLIVFNIAICQPVVICNMCIIKTVDFSAICSTDHSYNVIYAHFWFLRLAPCFLSNRIGQPACKANVNVFTFLIFEVLQRCLKLIISLRYA